MLPEQQSIHHTVKLTIHWAREGCDVTADTRASLVFNTNFPNFYLFSTYYYFLFTLAMLFLVNQVLDWLIRPWTHKTRQKSANSHLLEGAWSACLPSGWEGKRGYLASIIWTDLNAGVRVQGEAWPNRTVTNTSIMYQLPYLFEVKHWILKE